MYEDSLGFIQQWIIQCESLIITIDVLLQYDSTSYILLHICCLSTRFCNACISVVRLFFFGFICNCCPQFSLYCKSPVAHSLKEKESLKF